MGDTVIGAGARGNRCCWGLVVVVVIVVIVRPCQREEIKRRTCQWLHVSSLYTICMAELLASLATVNDRCHITLDFGITQFMANEATGKSVSVLTPRRPVHT